MKKLLFFISFALFFATESSAQIIQTKELAEYANKNYGKNWIEAADNISSNIQLDKNNGLTFVEIIEAPQKSKDNLYMLLNYWFTASFNDANSTIQLNDKDAGTIIAKGICKDIAFVSNGPRDFRISSEVIIKCDIKEGKIRVTFTVPYYSVVRRMGTDFSNEKWMIDASYPFNPKGGHKKASSKAFIMSYAYSQVLLDKIEECIKNGLTGNEDDNW